MKKTILTGLAVLAVTGGGVAYATGGKAQNRPAASATVQRQTTLAIENMTCALCPVTVKKAMEGVAGVNSVAVDFNAKTATVAFDPSRTTIAAIAQASTRAGYPAHPIKG